MRRLGCASLCIFILVLVFTTSAYGRALSAQGDQKIMPDRIHPYKEDDFSNVMGMDLAECEEKDEDCITRRMMAEAHLDYIYTQSQKPS